MRMLRRVLLSGLVVLWTVSCSTQTKSPAIEPGVLYWPSLPDQPRFAYETALRSTRDLIIEDANTRLWRRVTGEIQDQPAFIKPLAIAARNGRIYVLDAVQRHVVVFDVPRRRIFRFGERTIGRLSKPAGIALDDHMNVYVIDATLRKVMVYDGLGLFLREIGTAADFERPTGIAVSRTGDRVYVVDRSTNESINHRVVVFDGTGRKLLQIGKRGAEPGQFNVPVQASVGPDGALYVLDAGNFRVQIFDREGKFLRAFGSVGTGFGSFARPRGIAVDKDSNIYVTDSSFGNFQIFNSMGQLLLAIGQRGETDGPGKYALPLGISVDETGRVYVVDQFFNKVEVIRRLSDREGQNLPRRNAGG